MYVCICNSLKTGDIQKAVDSGCKKVKDVHKHCKSLPKCNECFEEISEIIDYQQEN